MRRTVLSAMTLACTAVLAGAVPAFADGATPSPARTSVPSATAVPTPGPTGVPSATAVPTPVPSATTAPSAAASAVPTLAPSRGQVSVVPSGAPDTGVAEESERSGATGGLIGGGAAAAFAVGGAAFYVVRRRRATRA